MFEPLLCLPLVSWRCESCQRHMQARPWGSVLLNVDFTFHVKCGLHTRFHTRVKLCRDYA